MQFKPILARLLSCIVLLVTVVGCAAPVAAPAAGGAAPSNSSGESSELVILRFPLMDDQDAETKVWDEMIAGFTKDHPNAKISIETQPWDDRRQKLLSAIGSGRGPDVFYINPDMISQFSKSGAIVPIDDFVTSDDTAKFNPGTLIPWEGKLYALPVLQNSVVYIYNTDLAKKLGLDPEKLPTTIDEVEQWAKTAKDNDVFFSTWSGNTATSGLTALIWQFGRYL